MTVTCHRSPHREEFFCYRLYSIVYQEDKYSSSVLAGKNLMDNGVVSSLSLLSGCMGG